MLKLAKHHPFHTVLVSVLVCALVGTALLADVARARQNEITSFPAAAKTLPGSSRTNLYSPWLQRDGSLSLYITTVKASYRLSNRTSEDARNTLLTWQRHVFPRYQEIALHVIHSLSLVANGIICLYLDIPPPFSASA